MDKGIYIVWSYISEGTVIINADFPVQLIVGHPFDTLKANDLSSYTKESR